MSRIDDYMNADFEVVKALEQQKDHTKDAPDLVDDLSLGAAARLDNDDVDVGASTEP